MVTIRKEDKTDHSVVFDVVTSAFASMPYSDGTEQHIVSRLRHSEAFVPELSLVAELDDNVIGHILLSEVKVISDQEAHTILSLAPVSVHPDYQRQGIGSLLIKHAHQVALDMGYGAVVLIGHHEYYPRFGYQPAHTFDITFPFDAPAENCMAIELRKDALKGVVGQVQYPQEFFN